MKLYINHKSRKAVIEMIDDAVEARYVGEKKMFLCLLLDTDPEVFRKKLSCEFGNEIAGWIVEWSQAEKE